MKCKKCGSESEGKFCQSCGESLYNNSTTTQAQQNNSSSGQACPKCGSGNVIFTPVTTTYTEGKTKGFGCIKAFLGWVFFSIPGILCGLCGMGKSKSKTITKVSTVKVCQNCGYRY